MITEKAISDFSWCSALIKEPQGLEKRFKLDRNWSDDTIDLIQNAITTGVSNKKAIVERIQDGNRVVAFDKNFWLVIKSGETQLLLTITEVQLVKNPGGKWRVEIMRNQRRKPLLGPGHVDGEVFVRVVIADAFCEVFENLQITVKTLYEGTSEFASTDNPTQEEINEADAFFQMIEDVHNGERQVPVNSDRCSICWWNKGCPKAVVSQIEIPPTTGKPTIVVL